MTFSPRAAIRRIDRNAAVADVRENNRNSNNPNVPLRVGD